MEIQKNHLTKQLQSKFIKLLCYKVSICLYYREILKAGMFLLPLLGMTWIIGILAVNNETQVFAWIFAILNSLQVCVLRMIMHPKKHVILQGLFIFIFHVARNKEVMTHIIIMLCKLYNHLIDGSQVSCC